MNVMEASLSCFPRFLYFERKVLRVAAPDGEMSGEDCEWMVDISHHERRDREEREGARNLMKQMETRVNCANTGRRNGMNGGRREGGEGANWWKLR